MKGMNLNELFESLKGTAKDIIIKYGYHSMIFFLVKSDDKGKVDTVLPSLVDEQNKDKIAEAIKKAIDVSNATAIIHVSEVYYVRRRCENETEKGKMMDVLPSEQEDRREALFISLQAKNKSESKICQIPFRKTESGLIIFDKEEINLDGKFEGRFGSWWK